MEKEKNSPNELNKLREQIAESLDEIRLNLGDLAERVSNIEDKNNTSTWSDLKDKEQLYTLANTIIENANILSEYKIGVFYDSNMSSEELNNKSFRDEAPGIQRAIDIACFLKNIPQNEFTSLPYQALSQTRDATHNMEICLKKMWNFSTEKFSEIDTKSHEKIKQSRNELAAIFQHNYIDFFNASEIVISSLNSGKVIALEKLVNKLTDERTLSGISEFNELYEKQAKGHFVASMLWVLAGGLALIFTIGFAWKSLHYLQSLTGEIHPYIIAGHISIKLFIMGLGSSILYWSLKNYRLSKHNEFLNKQKELALKTFKEFSTSAGTDSELRRTVLNKITGTIFDAQDMGYLGNHRDRNEQTNILSLAENLITKKE